MEFDQLVVVPQQTVVAAARKTEISVASGVDVLVEREATVVVDGVSEELLVVGVPSVHQPIAHVVARAEFEFGRMFAEGLEVIPIGILVSEVSVFGHLFVVVVMESGYKTAKTWVGASVSSGVALVAVAILAVFVLAVVATFVVVVFAVG